MKDGEFHAMLVNTLHEEWPERDTTAILCQRCGQPLDVHYAEERLYVVRCGACKTVALVEAFSPKEAAKKVGGVEHD